MAEGIFGGYDVRGVYGKNFKEKDAFELGKAYAAFLLEETGLDKKKTRLPKIVLGRDNRLSSPSLHSSFIKGVCEGGCNVTDVGTVPTPVVYFASFALKADGAAVITASHNPAEYNGVKMLRGIWPLSSRELLSVKKIFESKHFSEKPSALHGKVFDKGVLGDYLKFACSKIERADGLKIVVDGGNGIVGAIGVKLLKKLGAKVIPLYCEPDGRFPNHLPDPAKPENLKDLQAKVVREKADLGVAFDGDGDRAVFVDEKGAVVKSDEANVLFVREVLRKHKNAAVGFEMRCSMVIAEEIEKLGGKPIETKAGRIAVRDTMRGGAVFGCESTGHVCFVENNTFDDGIFASAKFAELVKKKNEPVSVLTASVKKYFSTRELRIPCENKFEVVEEVKRNLRKRDLNLLLVDGVKYSDEGGWGLVRAALTEPLLSVRFEGKTKRDLERIYGLFE
ncbi:MAG: phosphomannomutase/phosphoglucomutase, partial [Candidatus Micrarchaeota archaeon]